MDGTCPRCGPSTSSANPNYQNVCVKCGRMLTPRVSELHRAAAHAEDVPRDILWERRFTTEAARRVGVDPWPFIQHAEARILPGPWHGPRDWLDEGRQEASDWRNYLCVQAQTMVATGETELLPEVGAILSDLLALWHRLNDLDARMHPDT